MSGLSFTDRTTKQTLCIKYYQKILCLSAWSKNKTHSNCSLFPGKKDGGGCERTWFWLPSRKLSWRVRWGIERRRMSDRRKVGCPVPYWGPVDSVAVTACQIITSSEAGDTWLFTPEHARWLSQLSDHVLHVWRDSRGLCHSITHMEWEFSWLMSWEL